MSPQQPIEVDPDDPSGFECLFVAGFLQATDIPVDVSSRLPAETMSVSALLGSDIPGRVSNRLSIIQPAHLCFSTLDPCWTVDELFATPLPPRPWLNNLEENLSSMWRSGMRSILPPSSSRPKFRFPLWVAAFWNTAVEIAEQRDKWRGAKDWLAERIQDRDVREATHLFEKVPWGLRLWSLTGYDNQTRIGHLALLLSNEWLGERHIDAISSYLNMQAQQESGLRSAALVAGLDLSVYLSSNARATAETIQANEGLKMYAKKISDQRYSHIFIPANVGGNHWIIFSVDFEKCTFEYGNSLHDNGYSADINKLSRGIKRWGQVMFGKILESAGKTLDIGRQKDTSSCGICVVNSIEHCMFGVSLFTHNERNALRIYYFTKTVEFLVNSPTRPNANSNITNLPSTIAHTLLDVDPAGINGVGEGSVMDLDIGCSSGYQIGDRTPTVGQISLDEEQGQKHDYDKASRRNSGGQKKTNPYSQRMTPVIPTPVLPAGDSQAVHNLHSASPDSNPIEAFIIDEREVMEVDVVPDECSLDHQIACRSPTGVQISLDGRPTGVEGLKRRCFSVPDAEKGPYEGKKRKVVDEGEMGTDEEGSGEEHKRSRSAVASRKLRESVKSGRFVVDERKKDTFERKCKQMDERIKFRYGETWEVLHQKCGKWYVMMEPYNTTRFKAHLENCKSKDTKGHNTCISDYFQPKVPVGSVDVGSAKQPIMKARRQITIASGSIRKSDLETPPIVTGSLPCLGLREDNNSLIPNYISRALTEGAGSRSDSQIAAELFGDGTKYSKLGDKAKLLVQAAQIHSRTWTINRELQAVYSTTCKKDIDAKSTETTCPQCLSLLRSKAFKKALHVERAPLASKKFIPRRWRTAATDLAINLAEINGLPGLLEADSEQSEWIRFVSDVLGGKHKDQKLLLGLVSAANEKLRRKERQVGLQNFSYTSFLLQFSSALSVITPEGYRLLGTQVQLPTIRHHQMVRSRTPSFPIFINNDCFIHVQAYMSSIGYDGPVALGCDDTKLHPSLQVYWDDSISDHILIGTTLQRKIVVANPEELRSLLTQYKDNVATKLRLWCIVIPLIKLPTIVVAAEAIPDNLSAGELYPKSKQVIEGLQSHGVNVVSYASDGAAVERSIQDLFISQSKSVLSINIPDPEEKNYTIRIPLFGPTGSPVVMVQDSRHALKTMRNNLFSGARFLVLGNHTAMYSQVRDMAFSDHPTTPLYRRDVEKMDRQDDNAATRLFSAATLDFIGKHHPDRVGLAVYLFVMGEAVDAYQSRTISHLERVKMVLRCRYFLRLWKRFLRAASYPEAKYYISKEADDILGKLFDGLLALIYVYRNNLRGEYPLLPWMHSTEIVEHVFAECRKLVKDFTHLNFIFMTVRLHVLVRLASELGQGIDPKARAMGYSHAYLDPEEACLKSLAKFPSDYEIEVASGQAWEEAVTLLDFLGIQADDILPSPGSTSTPGDPTVGDGDTEETYDQDVNDDNEETTAAALQRMIGLQELPSWNAVGAEFQDKMHALTCAAMALDVEDQEKLATLEASLPVDEEQSRINDTTAIKLVSSALKGVSSANMGNETLALEGGRQDILRLVVIREAHQTRRAAKSTKSCKSSVPLAPVPTTSQRHQICSQMADVIRRSGTGIERNTRWKSGSAPGTKDSAEVSQLSGNSANAELAAKERVNAAASLRARFFNDNSVHLSRFLVDGLVGENNRLVPPRLPLTADCWGLVYSDEDIYLGEVITFYSKEAGAGSKHAWQLSTTSISSLSYIAVRAYEGVGNRNSFRSIHSAHAKFRALKFFHLPSTQFLCRLQDTPTALSSGMLSLPDKDWRTFREMLICKKALTEVIKKLNALMRGNGKA